MRERTVGADAAIWGMPIPVTDDLGKSAAWEGVRSTTVCGTSVPRRACVCEAASSPRLLVFGRKRGRFRNRNLTT